MVLTKKGEHILKNFKKQYGQEKGESNFYAYMKKFPKRTEAWHEGEEKK